MSPVLYVWAPLSGILSITGLYHILEALSPDPSSNCFSVKDFGTKAEEPACRIKQKKLNYEAATTKVWG